MDPPHQLCPHELGEGRGEGGTVRGAVPPQVRAALDAAAPAAGRPVGQDPAQAAGILGIGQQDGLDGCELLDRRQRSDLCGHAVGVDAPALGERLRRRCALAGQQQQQQAVRYFAAAALLPCMPSRSLRACFHMDRLGRS